MANARTDAEGKRAMEAMAAIARDMLENSEHINRDMYDRYADMRDFLRRGRFQLTECNGLRRGNCMARSRNSETR